MLVAIYATERCEIGRVRMAFGTACPLSPMLSAVNGEILCIMIKGGRTPCGSGVAILTGGGEPGTGVVWIPGCGVIRCMTAVTGSWRPGIGSVRMA